MQINVSEEASRFKCLPISGCGGRTSLISLASDIETSYINGASVYETESLITSETIQSLNSRTISTSTLSYLRAHYQEHVTPRLQWVDAPANPWRTIMPSLWPSSKALQFAVLSLSATHLWATSVQSTPLHDLPHSLRMIATRSLRHQISQQLIQQPEPQDQRAMSTMAIIATMLVLCHSEMLTPNSNDWTMHLQACRAVCAQECRSGLPQSVDGVVNFVKKALSDLEIFQSTSSFSGEYEVSNAVTPRDRSWIFMTVVREVTLTERRRYARSRQGFGNMDVDVSLWEAKLSRARALAFCHPLFAQAGLQHLQTQFREVAMAHHYAGLIYVHQALSRETEKEPIVQTLTEDLFSVLHSILECNWRNFYHDLFWPMFIAGSRAKFAIRRRSTVAMYYQQLMETTGFWCNSRALAFLQAYWDSGSETHQTWIHYARSRGSMSEPFLIY